MIDGSEKRNRLLGFLTLEFVSHSKMHLALLVPLLPLEDELVNHKLLQLCSPEQGKRLNDKQQ